MQVCSWYETLPFWQSWRLRRCPATALLAASAQTNRRLRWGRRRAYAKFEVDYKQVCGSATAQADPGSRKRLACDQRPIDE